MSGHGRIGDTDRIVQDVGNEVQSSQLPGHGRRVELETLADDFGDLRVS